MINEPMTRKELLRKYPYLSNFNLFELAIFKKELSESSQDDRSIASDIHNYLSMKERASEPYLTVAQLEELN